MRGMNSETVDLVYLDPPFKKQKPFEAKMTAKTEEKLLNYLAICEGGEDKWGNKAKARDKKFADKALEYVTSLRNDKGEIIMRFNDAWKLDSKKSSQLEKLKADRVDIYNLIVAIPDDDTKAYMIFMAVRILEMYRVLKPTGSIYLHCDYEANSYIRLIMDLVFGRDNMQNEVVWYYKNASRGKRRLAKAHDTIYWYSKSQDKIFNREDILVPFDSGMTEWRYKSGGQAGKPAPKGKTPDDVITMPSLNTMAKERIGYPTQKPVALLERIIKASSSEGDIVFDPFAGCATAIDAAYNLNRRWIACDLSYMAVILLRLRLEGPGLLGKKYPYKYTETEAPVRDDIKEQIDYSYEGIAKRVNVRKLYGAEIYTRQDGKCAITKRRINFGAGDIDHILPLADGGTNDMGNLQFVSTEAHRNKTREENSKR